MNPARLAFPACLVICVLLTPGCGKKSPTAPTGGETADALVAQANEQLGQILYALDNSPTPLQRPSDIDLRGPESLYQRALAADPTNLHAHFGVAVLGLLDLTMDREVNAAFDEWKAYLESHTPFLAAATSPGPLGIPLSPMAGTRALRLPLEVVPFSMLAPIGPRIAAVDPQIERVQDILSERALPRLEAAIAHLQIVGADPGYVFVVTSQMQGGHGATDKKIDHSAVLALRAAADLLAATCDVAVSYELGFAAYDSVGLSRAFEPGSGWLALRSMGASHMLQAGGALLACLDDLDATLVSLLAETGNQDDHVIKLGPDSHARAEAESLRVHLPEARQVLTGDYTRTEDWDSNPATPPVALTFRAGRLFTNPVQDWKALLPDYASSVIRRPLHTVPHYENGTDTVTVVIPADGTYSQGYWLSVSPSGITESPWEGDSLAAGLKRLVGRHYDLAQSLPDWDGRFEGGAAWYSGSLTAGPQVISDWYWADYGLVQDRVFVPVITWNASSFSEWTWPDPTMNGVLPQITNTNQLLSTFGITADRWAREIVLDWTAAGARPVTARAARPAR